MRIANAERCVARVWRRAAKSQQFVTMAALAAIVSACDTSLATPELRPTAEIAADVRTARFDRNDLLRILKDFKTAELGQQIFFDKDLSVRRNQSCASCHDPEWGWSAPIAAIQAGGGVMPGSVPTRFATRRPPTVSYASPSPIIGFDEVEGLWIGGNFFDGRATGQLLGVPVADQALAPFIGELEQALPDQACVVQRVSQSRYGALYRHVWGHAIDAINFPPQTDVLCGRESTTIPLNTEDRKRVVNEYNHVALSIAAFEDSRLVNQFSSKFDAFKRGLVRLSPQEHRGLELFEGKALCSLCHISQGKDALFTDYTFDNIGIPSNPLNPNLQRNPAFIDEGLGAFLKTGAMGPVEYQGELGKQKVATLRNIDKRPFPAAPKSFMHNGSLKSIEEVVHFYNTRDVLPSCKAVANPKRGVNCWPAPEVLVNVNVDELGNLGLTPAEEADLVAFLRTLTDGFFKNK